MYNTYNQINTIFAHCEAVYESLIDSVLRLSENLHNTLIFNKLNRIGCFVAIQNFVETFVAPFSGKRTFENSINESLCNKKDVLRFQAHTVFINVAIRKSGLLFL